MIRRPPRSPLFPHPPLSRSPPASADARTGRPARSDGPPAGPPLRWAAPPPPAGRPQLRRQLDGERRGVPGSQRSEEHTSELQSPCNLVCRLLLEKKKNSQRD